MLSGAGVSIGNLDSFMERVKKRHDFFHASGCRASDHGLEAIVAHAYTPKEIESIFDKARAGKALGPEEIDKFPRPSCNGLRQADPPAAGCSSTTWGHAQQQHPRRPPLGPDTRLRLHRRTTRR
jgi:glucuronate isomerase